MQARLSLPMNAQLQARITSHPTRNPTRTRGIRLPSPSLADPRIAQSGVKLERPKRQLWVRSAAVAALARDEQPSRWRQLITPFSDPQANARLLALSTGNRTLLILDIDPQDKGCAPKDNALTHSSSPPGSTNAVFCGYAYPRHLPARVPQ
jgi:hypothetical protein